MTWLPILGRRRKSRYIIIIIKFTFIINIPRRSHGRSPGRPSRDDGKSHNSSRDEGKGHNASRDDKSHASNRDDGKGHTSSRDDGKGHTSSRDDKGHTSSRDDSKSHNLSNASRLMALANYSADTIQEVQSKLTAG